MSLFRWLRSLSVKQRHRARLHDAEFLWPVLWEKSGGNPYQFIEAAVLHTSIDPNWAGHESEWFDTTIAPGAYAWHALGYDVQEQFKTEAGK